MRKTMFATALLATVLQAPTLLAQPPAVTLTAADTDPLGTMDQLAQFVGKRVRVSSLTVTAPTENGVFYGVVTGLDRPFRKAGLDANAPLPDGLCCVTRLPGTPELLRIDSSASPIDVIAGARLEDVAGVLQSSDNQYTIQLDTAPKVTDVPALATVRAVGETEFTVSSLNFSGSPEQAAKVIQSRLLGPDVLAVAANAPDLAKALSGTLYAAFGDHLLVNTSRLAVEDVSQIEDFTVARISALQPATDASSVTVVLAWLPAKDTFDLDAQQLRRTKAESLAGLIQDRQVRGERVLVLGDLQTYDVSDGYVDVLGTLMGRTDAAGQVAFDSPNVVTTPLINLVELLPAADRYSATEKGEAAAVDHVLASGSLRGSVTDFAYVRGNADYTPSTGRSAGRDHPLGFVSGLSMSNLSDAGAQVVPLTAVNAAPGASTVTFSIGNISRAPLRGPFHILFTGLPAGVTIANQTAAILGSPLLSLPAGVTTLAPGQSVSVSVQIQGVPAAGLLRLPLKVVAGSL